MTLDPGTKNDALDAPKISCQKQNGGLYRVGLVVWPLGWVDLDLGSSLARLVGRYCIYLLPKQTGWTPQIKTLRMTGRPTVYRVNHRIHSSHCICILATPKPNAEVFLLLYYWVSATRWPPQHIVHILSAHWLLNKMQFPIHSHYERNVDSFHGIWWTWSVCVLCWKCSTVIVIGNFVSSRSSHQCQNHVITDKLLFFGGFMR